ncbi:hypothetical protein HJFPF1_04220 [Paramyrothecium foliicola]|nr:hypothetical protein HJFPF1_04220 [Paramyrothecium foliicola]
MIVEAKHAFLDLDCIFSAGFIFVLAVTINSGQGQAYEGIDSARSILMYLANLGNRAAAKRLAEINQMCASLALQTDTPDVNVTQPQTLMQPFSFNSAIQRAPSTLDTTEPEAHNQEIAGHSTTDQEVLETQDATMCRVADVAEIVLEGEDDLYWMYHNPSLALTGVEQLDWEMLENQMVT